MNQIMFEKTIKFLEYQRNVLLSISIFLSIGTIILSSFLFLKRERIVIVPPVIERDFWIESDKVSASYLQQMGLFLGQLLLNKSSQSAASQRSVLLRYVDPAYFGVLKQRLIEEEEILTKQNASYVFYPIDIKVNQPEMSLKLVGERLLFVNGKQLSSDQEDYTFFFSYLGSKLFLKSITSEQKNKR